MSDLSQATELDLLVGSMFNTLPEEDRAQYEEEREWLSDIQDLLREEGVEVDLLSRPGVRERVVIIAVQTVLKTLLARGIKPHFVTALDYHEISARFYEGLTEADVEGVTLVVEPKANPAILKAWPGAIRCVGDHVLEQILGESLACDMGELTPGATVAHLAYYLARHLGCDPAIAHLSVMGSFPLHDSDQALRLLEAALPVRVRRLAPWWVSLEARA